MPEESKIDVGDAEEDAVDVTLSEGSDKPEEDSPAPVVVTEDSQEEELEEYSSGVKNRINELTKRFREEERHKQTAIEFAENVREENKVLLERVESLDKGYLEQFDGRINSELESAKASLKEAHETGDVDRIVSSQEALAELNVQKSTAKTLREPAPAPVEEGAAPLARKQAPAPAPADPKAEAWAARNTWFGKDEVMTYGAFGIHRRLVEDDGLDPASDEYYTALDDRLRTEFPHKLDVKPKTNGGRKVASAESSKSRNKGGRKTVRLTPSQVAIAKRLNVPLDEYAKYVRD